MPRTCYIGRPERLLAVIQAHKHCDLKSCHVDASGLHDGNWSPPPIVIHYLGTNTLTIGISCPKCATRYQVRPELSGRSVRCKACQHQFLISRSQGNTNVEDAITLVAPPARTSAVGTDNAYDDIFDDNPDFSVKLARATPRPKPKEENAKRQVTSVDYRRVGINTVVATLVISVLITISTYFKLFDFSRSVVIGLGAMAIAFPVSFIMSMFDEVRRAQQEGRRVPWLVRLLFTPSLFRFVAWTVFLAVSIVLGLTFLLGDFLLSPVPR